MRILGSEKVATAEDIQHLPFIRGLVKETLRYIDLGEMFGVVCPHGKAFYVCFTLFTYLTI